MSYTGLDTYKFGLPPAAVPFQSRGQLVTGAIAASARGNFVASPVVAYWTSWMVTPENAAARPLCGWS